MQIDKNACLGCGSCKRSCPMAVIKMGEDGKAEMAKPQRCIRCFHCTAACPVKAVHIDGNRDYQPKRENRLESVITSRRSVRHYTDAVPDKETLLHALNTAMYAPSGKNIHENKWSVLYGKDQVQKALRLALDWAEATMNESRPSTSCWLRWTALAPTPALSSWQPPTAGISLTRLCCVRDALTARLWSVIRMSRAERKSLRFIPETNRWVRMWN